MASGNFLVDLLKPLIFFHELSLLLPHMDDFLLDFEKQVYLLVFTALIRSLSPIMLVVLIIGEREIFNG